MSSKQQPARGRSAKPTWQQEIAGERIQILMKLAEDEFSTHPQRSDRYVSLSRRIATRYNIKIPKGLKRRICKHCYGYLSPGSNCIIRSDSRTRSMDVKCLGCGGTSRYPYRSGKA